MPDDRTTAVPPLTELVAAAAATHEVYLAYVEAGFTRTEAMQFVVALSVAALRTNGPTTGE